MTRDHDRYVYWDLGGGSSSDTWGKLPRMMSGRAGMQRAAKGPDTCNDQRNQAGAIQNDWRGNGKVSTLLSC